MNKESESATGYTSLFTPEPDPSARIPHTNPSPITECSGFPAFYVELPQLSAAVKAHYQALPLRNIDEIIGEYNEKGEKVFYARYKGGIAYKASPFANPFSFSY
jgi:hypothetical protein